MNLCVGETFNRRKQSEFQMTPLLKVSTLPCMEIAARLLHMFQINENVHR